MKRIDKDKLEKLTDIILCIFIVMMFVAYEGKNSIIYFITLMIFGIITLLNIITYKKLLFDKKVAWMLLFVAFAGISYFWAGNKKSVISVLLILIANELIAYFIMLLIHYKNKRFEYILNSIIIGTIILALRLFIPNGFLAYYSTRTIDGFNANYLGMYAAVSANFALYYFFNESKNKNKKILYIICFILSIIITILSFSRKAIIFVILPMAIYYIFKDYSLKKSIIRIFISIVAVGILLLMLFKVDILYNTMGYRIEAMINGVFNTGGEIDASVSARMKMIEVGKELFVEKPIFGYGLNNYKDMLLIKKPYGMTNVYAHNNYIELAVDLGIIGLLIYYSFYILIILYTIKNFKRMNKLQIMMMANLITLMVCEYGIVSYYGDFYHLLLSLTWMAVIYIGKDKNEK